MTAIGSANGREVDNEDELQMVITKNSQRGAHRKHNGGIVAKAFDKIQTDGRNRCYSSFTNFFFRHSLLPVIVWSLSLDGGVCDGV